MKKMNALLTVISLITSSAFAEKPKIIFERGVVEIHADDLDYAKDAVFEQSALYPGAVIKVYVAPLPKPDVKALLKGEKLDIRISFGKSLVGGYKIAYDIVLAEMEKHESGTVKKMKADPYDIRGNLAHIEQYLGLDKINSKELLLMERCYRVCWVEGIYRYKYAENVELIFK